MKFRAHLIALAALLALLTTATAADAKAKANWISHCAKCHGENGRGETKQGKQMKIPDLSTKQIQSLFTDEQAFKIIKEGLRDDTDKVSMKAVEGLSDEEIRAIIPYIRTLKK